MKRITILFFTICLSSQLICEKAFQLNISDSEPEAENVQPTDSQIILGHFGNIVGNMFNIMQNPENPQNVGTSITGIFANIVGLAVHAIQDKLGSDATEQEINEFIENLDPEIKDQLHAMIVKRARQVRTKIINT
jgi:hypothetical protein